MKIVNYTLILFRIYLKENLNIFLIIKISFAKLLLLTDYK
jgi:hypothetical protein